MSVWISISGWPDGLLYTQGSSEAKRIAFGLRKARGTPPFFLQVIILRGLLDESEVCALAAESAHLLTAIHKRRQRSMQRLPEADDGAARSRGIGVEGEAKRASGQQLGWIAEEHARAQHIIMWLAILLYSYRMVFG